MMCGLVIISVISKCCNISGSTSGYGNTDYFILWIQVH